MPSISWGGICTARPPMTTTMTARVADTMMIMTKEMRHVVVALAVAVGGASAACKALIKAASEKWHEHEGDYRDDITVILFN